MALRKLVASLALALAVPALAANRSEVKLFDIGQEVTAIAVTADGSTIWFCQAWTQQIARLDTATGAVRYWPIPSKSPTGDRYAGGQPYDIVIDDFGDVWFNELPGRGGGASYVTRFRPATETFEQFLLNPAWWNGYGGDIWLGQGGLAKGFDGKIWFTDNSGGPIVGSIDPATGAVTSFSAGLGPSTDIAVSSTGKVYVSTWRTRGLARVDPLTGASAWLPEFSEAWLGTADAAGNVWFSADSATEPAGWTVPARVADDGTVTFFRDAARFSLPGYYGQMAADASGHVWIGQDVFNYYGAQFTNELTELDPSSGAVTTYDLPFKPEYMSINGSQIAASGSAVLQPAKIALVVDLDRDGDGVLGKQDCNDRDPASHPGALEVKRDGVDQDCNGYDLTIQVAKATFRASNAILRVEATSLLGAAAALQVAGIGPMKWDATTGRWIANLPRKTNPGTVTVCGIEGCDQPVTVVSQ